MPRRGVNTVNGGTFNTVTDLLFYTAALTDRVTYLNGLPTATTIATVVETIGFVGTFLVNDLILLNYGLFSNQRLYFNEQEAYYIPFPVARPDAPAAYVGLTNQQLWDQFGIALGGAIVPANAYKVLGITGWLAPA
jgi:hypothetical protein